MIDRWRGAAIPAVAAFAGCLVLSGAAVLWRGRAAAAPTVQPIQFNHKKHVEELELTCLTCHAFFETETFSGLPAADVCSTCHSQAQGKSPEEARLVRLLQTGAPLEWRSLFRQPGHVFYSHRRHVVAGKLECANCHGAIAKTSAPPTRVRRLRMQDCIDCHRRSGASADCTNCHR